MMYDLNPADPALAYPATQFPACFGVNHGDAISHPAELSLGDSYKLLKSATPVQLGAYGGLSHGRPQFVTSPEIGPSQTWHASALLTFVSEHGETWSATLLRNRGQALLLPQVPLKEDVEYVLISVDTRRQAALQAATMAIPFTTGTRFAYHA